jgi:hypothetical protein
VAATYLYTNVCTVVSGHSVLFRDVSGSGQRPVFYFAARAVLTPWSELWPLGVKLFPSYPPSDEEPLFAPPFFNSMYICRECSHLEVNEGVNIYPRERSSPLGASKLILLKNRPKVSLAFFGFEKIHTLIGVN